MKPGEKTEDYPKEGVLYVKEKYFSACKGARCHECGMYKTETRLSDMESWGLQSHNISSSGLLD